MAKTFQRQKVDLIELLGMISAEPGSGYGPLVDWSREVFTCSQRAVKDALAVIRQAGYVSVDPIGPDRRRRGYTLTARGERLLNSPNGAFVARFARQLYTSCGSKRIARRQANLRVSGERELLLERVEAYYLSPTFVDTRTAIRDAPLPAGALSGVRTESTETGTAGAVARPRFVEPRCKVCRSEQREEVDLMLARGRSQASIHRELNELLGRAYFTANNISSHARFHVSQADPAVRAILDLRLMRQELSDRELYRALQLARQDGLVALNLGITQATPADMIAAVRVLDQPEPAGQLDSPEEMRHEFDAFIAAVRGSVPPEQFEQVMEHFEQNQKADARLTGWTKRERLPSPNRQARTQTRIEG
jgi:hypothetical protein